MNDDWSLKGKRITEIKIKKLKDKPKKDLIKYKDNFLVLEIDPPMFYVIDDIETLRQKLIKDLDERTLSISFKLTSKPDECFKVHINLIKAQIVDIINKRFGVEDNAESKK